MKKYLLIFTIANLGAFLFNACNSVDNNTAAEQTKTEVSTTDKNPAAVAVVNKEGVDGYEVGDRATDFKLKSVDGETYSLKSFENAKGYIVTFTCNTCPWAVLYEDRLIALHNKFEPMGYPVVAIQPNDPDIKPGDSFEAMAARAKEKGFPFVYLIDEQQEVFPAYGATRTPHIYLLDSELTVQYIGAIDDNPKDAEAVNTPYVENAIMALEKGTKPDPSFTKAIGCSIKKKS